MALILICNDGECLQVQVTKFPNVLNFVFDNGVEVQVTNYFSLSSKQGRERLAAWVSQLGFGTPFELEQQLAAQAKSISENNEDESILFDRLI